MKLELDWSCGRADIICDKVRIAPDVDGEVAREIVKRVNEHEYIKERYENTIKLAESRLNQYRELESKNLDILHENDNLIEEINNLRNDLDKQIDLTRELVRVLNNQKEFFEDVVCQCDKDSPYICERCARLQDINKVLKGVVV